MACAQRIRHIPPHPHENDLCGEMGTLKIDRHRRSPSCITVGHRGRSYCKSPQMKICDKTVPTTPLRTLALDPGTREMGYAVLESTDLFYFGVHTFPHRCSARRLC